MAKEKAAGFETPQSLRAQCVELLGWKTPLALFPVRHHSPTGARHLAAWLETYQPDVVLIEGPAAFNDRIDLLADPEHVAPFALIAAGKTDDGAMRARTYYPMCDYSPELVALRLARKLGAKARFIDLVFDEREDATQAIDQQERLGSSDDKLFSHSALTRELCEQSGCRDFDEVWESLFEQHGWNKSPEAWAIDVTAYSLMSRASHSHDELVREGTLAREGAMAWHMAEAQKLEGKKGKAPKVAVITGAFHTVALRATAPVKPAKSEAELFLAPYTFPRLDSLLGYASGMAGPQFYQWVWEAAKDEDPFAVGAQRVLVEATRLARRDGEVVGTADAIAAVSFAQNLAALRNRPLVGRVEVIEAAQSCFIKGDSLLVGARVRGAVAEVMRGTKVGSLGKSAGQSPLVTDFYEQCKTLRLPIEHGRPDKKELEIFRSALDLARSRFFHQCQFLELEFAEKKRGPDLQTGEGMHLTVEHWDVQFVPEIEPKLLEHVALGATIEDVATALLVKAWLAAEGQTALQAQLLLRGLVMGLHRPLKRILPRLSASMLADDDVISLLQAGSLLRTVLTGRERLSPDLVGLPALAKQAFAQGAVRLERLAGLSADRVENAIEATRSLLDVVLTEPELAPSQELVIRHAESAREAARAGSPGILGALDGLLFQLVPGRDSSRLILALKTLTRGRTRVDGIGAYLEGLMAMARQALLGESGVLEALLAHVRDAEWQDFLATLPALRRAFTKLTPRETEAVAQRAAAMLGISATEAVQLLQAPPEVVAKLADWERAVSAAEETWAGPLSTREEHA